MGSSHGVCDQLRGDGRSHNAQGQGGGQEQGQGREAYLQEVRGKRQEVTRGADRETLQNLPLTERNLRK